MGNSFRGFQKSLNAKIILGLLGLSLSAACSNATPAPDSPTPPPVSTQADLTGPSVISSFPASGGVVDLINSTRQVKKLTVTFNEPVTNLASQNITLTSTSTVTENVPVTVQIDPANSAVVNITATLVTGTNYNLTLGSGAVTDLAGNQYLGGNSETFAAKEITVFPGDEFSATAASAD